MSLKDQITEDMKTAMRAKDTARLETIRLLTAAIKQKEVDERVTVSDQDIQAILQKMIKQRKESVAQFTAGNRMDLVDKENAEIEVLQKYLPAQLSQDQILAAIEQAFSETEAKTAQEIGKVVQLLKGRIGSQADMSFVAAQVKARLSTS